LCVGVIPGPQAPKEIATYLEPLIDELEDLARGVPAFDAVDEDDFPLRAYLITCFGDMPAMAKLMSMKGPNGRLPCRACKIEGIGASAGTTAGTSTGPISTTLYTPLSRTWVKDRNYRPRQYEPDNLPRRTHVEHLQQALDIEAARTDADEEVQQRNTGVNGLSPLARLGSLSFPTTFPHDFMHIMFENVLPSLFNLWIRDGRWIGFGTGTEDYLLGPKVWSDVGAACASSGNTTPAAFGCRVPDIAEKRHEFSAESMMLFATVLAPALLRNRFRWPRYYDHFIRLVKLINMCLGQQISRTELQEIREGFAQWVQDFERYNLFIYFVLVFRV
jgi:hypothetical protein